MTIKVLLDTDIGSDVDDAVALAYLLSQPQCDLLGITTVTGEAVKRASLASVLCQVAGRDIPIYPGAEAPLQIEQRQKEAKQADALQNWRHETLFPEGKAVEFMRSVIHAHPGEVILLAIAPLTNIAQLFQSDPEIPALLKGLVMMGGVFSPLYGDREKVEWNILLDPHAAEIVYRAPLHLHRSVGLEVTERVILPAAEVRTRFQTPILKPVLDFAEIWFAQATPKITFHDPLTAATIFDETLCAFQPGTVQVDTLKNPGKTSFEADGMGAPHQVAVSVDPERYLTHFFSVVS